MLTIRDILRAKGSAVVTIQPDAKVLDAMRLLVKRNIGALVVLQGETIAGIITERDLLRAGAGDPDLLKTAHVRDLMSTPVVTAVATDSIHSVMETMTERRIRHLPIVEGKQLTGMVSIGDVINAVRRNAEYEKEQLQAYITGTPL